MYTFDTYDTYTCIYIYIYIHTHIYIQYVYVLIRTIRIIYMYIYIHIYICTYMYSQILQKSKRRSQALDQTFMHEIAHKYKCMHTYMQKRSTGQKQGPPQTLVIDGALDWVTSRGFAIDWQWRPNLKVCLTYIYSVCVCVCVCLCNIKVCLTHIYSVCVCVT